MDVRNSAKPMERTDSLAETVEFIELSMTQKFTLAHSSCVPLCMEAKSYLLLQ